MYRILDLYNQPIDTEYPVVCIDEKSKQLIENSRTPIKMKTGIPLKEDYEYKRKGTINLFVAVEPKAGKHVVKMTERRGKTDFAYFIKDLLEKHYSYSKKLRIVLDNLNTHFAKSFHDTFSKEEAEEILNKIDFYYTPKHASWLNMAEIEIGILEKECINRRIGSSVELEKEVKAWTKQKNVEKMTIDWSFTKRDAYKKLAKHYVT